MSFTQHTVAEVCAFEGKGLHTGVYSHMRVLPADADTGIVFRRVDLPGAPEIPALAENVTSTARSTTIACGKAEAVTIEHIMSALTGLGIDNAVIELDNREVPILDGSALPYVSALKAVDQGVPRRFVDIPYAVEVRDPRSGGFVRIEPASAPSADVKSDFGSRVLGIQEAHWDLRVDYAREIGPCRTFCFFHEIEPLLQSGLIKGGDVDNAIVVVEHPVTTEQLASLAALMEKPSLGVKGGYLSNLELRFPDECGRHKLLDLMGDLRLAGGYLNAKISAYKAGHTINTKAAKALRALLK